MIKTLPHYLHDSEELETNNSHNSKESESDKRKGDTDANMFQDKTKRSFVTIDVRFVVMLYIIMELELTVISRMYTKLHGLNTLITFDPCKENYCLICHLCGKSRRKLNSMCLLFIKPSLCNDCNFCSTIFSIIIATKFTLIDIEERSP